MNCTIYVRFSPRKNASKCESCEVQEAYCRQFAKQKGWNVTAVFADKAVSGTVEIDGRELHNAIFSLKKGDVLLAYRRDRFARDLIIGLEVERAVESRGASVAVVDGDVYGSDPGAVLMKQMLMVIAEYERKIISSRTGAAMRQYQREGRRMSKSCPYGWRDDPEDPRRMVRDEEQQKVIAEIISRRKSGESYRRIANALNERGGTKATLWTADGILRVYRRATA